MKLIYNALLLFVFATSLKAQQIDNKELKNINSMEDLQYFITFYYTNPKPKLIPNAILFIRNKSLSSNSNLERHFVPFFGEVFKHNQESIPTFFESINDLSDDDIYIFSQALHWSESKYSKPTIQYLLQKTKNTDLITSMTKISVEMKPINLLEIDISSTEQLDMLWNSFFATGNENFLEKIVLTTEIQNKPVNQIILSQAARWSIKANSKNHSLVRNFCIKNKSKYTENINQFLQSIIE